MDFSPADAPMTAAPTSIDLGKDRGLQEREALRDRLGRSHEIHVMG
jgi:hypothetical protein